jgi:hypothetical protein
VIRLSRPTLVILTAVVFINYQILEQQRALASRLFELEARRRGHSVRNHGEFLKQSLVMGALRGFAERLEVLSIG